MFLFFLLTNCRNDSYLETQVDAHCTSMKAEDDTFA